MTEKCKQVRDVLSLEGRVPNDAALQEHLDSCSECAQFLKSLLAVEGALQTYEAPDVSDDVIEKLLVRADMDRIRGSQRATRQWVMGLAAAAMVAFVAVRFLFLTAPDISAPAAKRPQPARQSVIDGNNEPVDERDVEALDSLGYVGNYEYEELPDDGLRENSETKDKVIPRETWMNEGDVAQQEELKRRELDQRGIFRPLEDYADADVPAEKSGDDFAEERQKKEDVAEGLSSTLAGSDSVAAFEAEPDPAASAAVGGYTMTTEVVPNWRKRVHVDPVYPTSARQGRLEGTVQLVITIDPEGNVTDAEVLRSIPPLDQAAIDAVLQWKYEPSELEEMRHLSVTVDFELDEPEQDASLSFLGERARMEGLEFQEARGYWANSYVPGDPTVRYLGIRLRKAQFELKPHLAARPVAQPFDAPARGAMSVFLHADRRGLSEPSRLLVQVGLKATEHHGRRRPPMNVGIVVDTDTQNLAEARALMDALREMKALGDRFRLVFAGQGEVVAPESFRHGPLTLALSQPTKGDLVEAARLAIEKVHAGDDPTMPLGTSLVLLVTSRGFGDEGRALTRIAHKSAVGGIPVSVVGIGENVDRDALERLALAGQGRRYFLDHSDDAVRIVEDELAATSRTVARALRLRIKLAPGVKLIDVLDSEPLSERQADRVREAEKSIDLRLARNLGIEADRGEDEDGIQIVIPSFYAGDAHTILLDVVAPGPGPIADVTLRYKDLADLDNTVAKTSLSLAQVTSTNGPLETNVLKNFFALHLSRELESAADALERGDQRAAIARLTAVRDLLTSLPFGHDREIASDVAMLTQYVAALSSPAMPLTYLADSLRYAGASKRRLPVALT